MNPKFAAENIPEEMKAIPRWVLYSVFVNSYSQRIEKLPKTVTGKMADITKPETWTTYEKAYGAYVKANGAYAGLGFVLGDGIFGIDLDHVIDDGGNIAPWAEEIIKRMDSYTEISPSGTGIHIFARGKIPSRDRRNGSVEMYDDKRYFTVTGNCWEKPRALEERTREAAAIHRQYLKRDHRESASGASEPRPSVAAAGGDVNDLVSRAGAARNGDKFMALWKGSTAGYSSHSQADQALCNLLAFYSGGDRALMDAAFRSSGLMRTKWDSKRGGTTYGGLTLDKAMEALGSQEASDFADLLPPLPVDKKAAKSDGEGEKASAPPLPVDTPVFEAPGSDQAPLTAGPSALPVPPGERGGLAVSLSSLFSDGFVRASGASLKAATGFSELDARLGGGFGSGIILLGSEPSIGKTSLLLQAAVHCALDGARVFYLSFEQDLRFLSAKVFANLLSSGTGKRVLPEEVLSGSRDSQIALLLRDGALSRFAFLDSAGIASGDVLLREMERLWQETHEDAASRGKPVMFYIDYLQIIPFAGASVYSIRSALDDFIRRLRQLQMRTGISVVLISSLNRMAYMGPVRLDSFKESGVIEFTGDVILGLNLRAVRGEEYLRLSDPAEKNLRLEAARGRRIRELEITCLKNKYGESSFSVDVNFDTETGVFTELKSR